MTISSLILAHKPSAPLVSSAGVGLGAAVIGCIVLSLSVIIAMFSDTS